MHLGVKLNSEQTLKNKNLDLESSTLQLLN